MLIFNTFCYVISFLMIVSSIVVILAKNPMISVLSLIFVFTNAAILFVLLHAEFIAMTILIIYIGAISVLFIFIIMLLNIKTAVKRKLLNKNLFFGLSLTIAVFIEIAFLIKSNLTSMPNIQNMKFNNDINNSYNLALDLYDNHFSLIIMIGLILTIVVIGIVYICYEDNSPNVYKQKMFLQVQRDPKSSVRSVKVENEKGIE